MWRTRRAVEFKMVTLPLCVPASGKFSLSEMEEQEPEREACRHLFVPANATAFYLGYADACTATLSPRAFGDDARAISVTVASRPLPGR